MPRNWRISYLRQVSLLKLRISCRNGFFRRLSLTELKQKYPRVDFSAIRSEDDPLWKDGFTRETWFSALFLIQICFQLDM